MRRQSLFLGGLIAGGAAMYLLDPSRGRRRRRAVRDRARRLGRTGADTLERAVRRSAQEARGLGWRISHAWNRSVPDEVLAERVRSQVGHAVRYGGKVEVTVHDGRVRLAGPVFCSEVRRLLHRVSRVPGVTDVVNDLEAYDDPCGRVSISG